MTKMGPASLAIALLSLAATSAADCSRDVLKDITYQYISAQASGKSANMVSLTSGTFNYTENEVAMDISKGILSQPLKIDHNISIHDPVTCGTFTELIVANSSHPYVIGTRILLGDDDKVSLIESIVTDKGDWAFNATGYLYWASQEKWDPIPEDKRDSRDVIKAAGDAYFNRFANANLTVPFGTPCARLEGGAYTGQSNVTADTCGLGLPSTITVTNRRYIVDEEMGCVDIFLGFPGLDRSVVDQPMPDSHLFRVEGGKIRYIHTVSSCVNDGCGLNGTLGPPPGRRSIRTKL